MGTEIGLLDVIKVIPLDTVIVPYRLKGVWRKAFVQAPLVNGIIPESERKQIKENFLKNQQKHTEPVVSGEGTS